MEDTAAVAIEILEPLQDTIFQGLTVSQVDQAREGILNWLQARMRNDEGKSLEERALQVQDHLPQELRDMFSGLSDADRFDAAATAVDQLCLRTLDRRINARAQAFLDKSGDMGQLKTEAESDLTRLRDIENTFQSQFPRVYETNRRIISESKIDSFYVIRDGGAVSLRLGRAIARSKRQSS